MSPVLTQDADLLTERHLLDYICVVSVASCLSAAKFSVCFVPYGAAGAGQLGLGDGEPEKIEKNVSCQISPHCAPKHRAVGAG